MDFRNLCAHYQIDGGEYIKRLVSDSLFPILESLMPAKKPRGSEIRFILQFGFHSNWESGHGRRLGRGEQLGIKFDDAIIGGINSWASVTSVGVIILSSCHNIAPV